MRGIILAVRYSDEVGYVWNAILRTFDAAALVLGQLGYSAYVAFPALGKSCAYSNRIFGKVELDLYKRKLSQDAEVKLKALNAKLIIYISATPKEIDRIHLCRMGIKTVSWEQESYGSHKTDPLWKKCIKWLLRSRLHLNLHDLYLANSNSQAAFLANYACIPPSRIKLLNNAVDTEYFVPKYVSSSSLSLPPAEHYLVTVCQAREEKRVDVLIDVCSLLAKRRTDFIWLYVGDGPRLGEWEKLAKNLGQENRFIFLGHKGDVRPYLNVATCLVHSAERESFGYVVAEAMACEKPVVAFEADGPKDIVLQEENGYLVEQGNLPLMTERIYQLLENPELVKNMGACARARVLSMFSITQQSKKLAICLDAILANAKS